MKHQRISFSALTLAVVVLFGACQSNSGSPEDSASDVTLEQTDEQFESEETSALDAKPKQVAGKSELKIYPYTAADVKPIYGKKCPDAEDPWACTLKTVQKEVSKNLEWPEEALEQGQDGHEEVTFVIMPDGSLGDIKYVLSKDKPCEGCQKAAVEAVGQLGTWQPALIDGEPVAVKMTLPIRFKSL